MSKYSKSLAPPDGEPFLETSCGLKYWLVYDLGPKRGLLSSVLTEDPEVSMHVYGGGRERGDTYLMCYKGFQFGFFCMDSNYGEYPWWDVEPEFDKAANTVTLTITGIGTPVWDEAATMVPDGAGNFKVDIMARRRGESYVTGLSFNDYNAGKRTKFQSRQQQDDILRILPDMFVGLEGNLKKMRVGSRPGPKRLVRFSTKLSQEIRRGNLIRQRTHKELHVSSMLCFTFRKIISGAMKWRDQT